MTKKQLKNLTKKQRRDIYWATMFRLLYDFNLSDEELEEEGHLRASGICWSLYKVTDDGNCYEEMKERYPELYQQKPKKEKMYGNYWFEPGKKMNKRLKCLSRAIDLCNQ